MGPLKRRLEPEAAWPIIGLTAASLFGAVVGLTAIPSAWVAIIAMTLVQLAVTGLGVISRHRPVLWAVAIAVVSLGTALLDPRLSELTYEGAIPWISLGTALATLNLYRRARDWSAISAGTAALVLGSISLVTVSIRNGVPAATAILAASVPFLIGVIIALVLHLHDAREDRIRRPELRIDTEDSDTLATPGQATLDAARRALAIVALRSDELTASTSDVSTRRAAADLREVARGGLSGPVGTDQEPTRIEIHPASGTTPAPPGEDASTSPTTSMSPMPELPEREREILRLVATGASNASIGRNLYLSEATVKQYVSRLMRKFDKDNRTQLALMAARWFDHT